MIHHHALKHPFPFHHIIVEILKEIYFPEGLVVWIPVKREISWVPVIPPFKEEEDSITWVHLRALV